MFSKMLFIYCFLILFLFSFSSYAQQKNCSEYRFSNNNLYSACDPLPVLDSFLHWNYHPSNHTVDIAYRHTNVTASNWVAWSLNLGRTGMIGAQCLVAFVDSTGTPRSYTTPITGYGATMHEGNLSFAVPSIAAEFGNNQMIIYATIKLPPGTTSFNQVWQHGDVSRGVLQMHPTTPEHLRSFARVDFATGTTSDTGSTSGGGSRQRRRNAHGVLNVVSWGIMMPLGAMVARYLKLFKSANPAWFYLHVTCQTSAYIVGVAGLGTGLKLGRDSPGIERNAHRNIGITLSVLATLQVFALAFRPKPDHKYRIYWNVYHQLVGYTVIALSIANIFAGLDILDPDKKWKRAYIAVLIAMGAIATCLEAFKWFQRFKEASELYKHSTNGTNGCGA
ncbi:hypothetical protein OROHE_016760 [Orobanche hederae]